MKLIIAAGCLFYSMFLSCAEVIYTAGDTYYFENGQKTPKKLIIGTELRPKDILITGPFSYINLHFSSNALVSIGPSSQVHLSQKNSTGIYLISLWKGKMHVQKKPGIGQSQNIGVLSSVWNAPQAIIADEYVLTHSKEETSVNILKGKGMLFTLKEKI